MVLAIWLAEKNMVYLGYDFHCQIVYSLKGGFAGKKVLRKLKMLNFVIFLQLEYSEDWIDK